MNLQIDSKRCTGHGMCEGAAGDVFEVGTDGFAPLMVEPGEDTSVPKSSRPAPSARPCAQHHRLIVGRRPSPAPQGPGALPQTTEDRP